MKSRSTRMGLLWLVLISFILISAPVSASSRAYSVKDYDVYVRLQPDGSAQVTETIEYHMHENLRDFRYELIYAPAGSIDLEKVGVADKPASFDQIIFVEAQRAKDISSHVRPLTYHLKDNGDVLQIALHVFSEADSIRTVSISYYLHRMVIRQQDTAVLQHEFFNSGVAGDIENARVTFRLPQATALAETWNLPISLAEFKLSQPREDQIRLASEFIHADDTVILTSLLPLEIFPEAVMAAEQLSRGQLIESARSRNDMLQRQYETRKSLLNLIYVLLVLSLILSLIIYGRFDRESRNGGSRYPDPQVLCSVPPAILAVLKKKKKPANLILSTLFDLVRRDELERDGLVFFRKNKNSEYIGCRAYEIFLLQWLFDHLSGDDVVSMTEIRRIAQDSSTAEEFQIYYRQFCVLIQEAYDETGYIDQKKTRQGRLFNSCVSLVYLVLGFIFTFTLKMPAGIFLFFPAVWFFIYSLLLRRQSTKGVACFDSAQMLRQQISRLHKIDQEQAELILVKCLPQAMALDRAIHLLQGIVHVLPDGLQYSKDSELSVYGISSKNGRWTASVAALAEDIKVMDSLLSASYLLASGIHS